MLVRWVIALVLMLGVVITALDLSANVRDRARARRPASVAHIVADRADEQSPPHAAEMAEVRSTAPAITY